jgi:hypothetical protein
LLAAEVLSFETIARRNHTAQESAMGSVAELISHYVARAVVMRGPLDVTSAASAIHAVHPELSFEDIEDLLLRNVIAIRAEAFWCGCEVGSADHLE